MLRQAAGARAPSVLRRLARPLSTARQWKVYLSGEIHSDWREVIAEGVASKGLPVTLSSPNTSHEDSDDCAAIILGMEEKRPNWDRLGATMNSIRTKTLLEDADVVVVRFGEKYRQVSTRLLFLRHLSLCRLDLDSRCVSAPARVQWNAAFEAGYAAARGKSIITLHPPAIAHMLKEVNAAASAVCEQPEQVVDILDYVITGKLPTPKDGSEFVPIVEKLGKGNPNP